jgi:hypothetical protein
LEQIRSGGVWIIADSGEQKNAAKEGYFNIFLAIRGTTGHNR